MFVRAPSTLSTLVINFNTGFDRKGIVVMKRREIVLNYLRGWFWLDLVASFPYTWVINFEEDSISDV